MVWVDFQPLQKYALALAVLNVLAYAFFSPFAPP